MNGTGTITAIIVSLSALAGAAAEQRAFTDRFGREIKAEIESVRPPNVYLKRADGKTFLMPVEKLSDADQAYVKKWFVENPQIKLDYRFDKEKKGAEGKGDVRSEEWAYEVTVSNRGYQDLEELKFEYTIYKQLTDRYAKDKRRISGAIKGSDSISVVERQRDASFLTNTINTGKVNKVTRTRGSNYIESVYEKWDEDLVGIRITVTHRDKVIDTREFGIVPDTDAPIAEIAKATRTSRTLINNNQ